jgi:GNAT superfamily N-acetyltransferase
MTPHPFQIRPAMSADYAGIAAVISDSEPEVFTADVVKDWFERLPPGRITYRPVAVDLSGTVIGYAAVVHETYHTAGHFYTWVVVDHDHRRKGIGTALYQDAQDFVKTQNAASLQSEVRDNCPEGQQFARELGFRVDRHLFESTLDLVNFDCTRFASVVPDLEASGITFKPYSSYANTSENRRKLYDLNATTTVDIPGMNDAFMSYEDFIQAAFASSWFRPEGVLIAAAGDEWVGTCTVEMLPETQGAYNIFTGVLPTYRGRKIALALKLQAIAYARSQGAVYIRTNNDSQNAPMLAVNHKLGYQHQPGKYILKWP